MLKLFLLILVIALKFNYLECSFQAISVFSFMCSINILVTLLFIALPTQTAFACTTTAPDIQALPCWWKTTTRSR
jgi:hypothetical protein